MKIKRCVLVTNAVLALVVLTLLSGCQYINCRMFNKNESIVSNNSAHSGYEDKGYDEEDITTQIKETVSELVHTYYDENNYIPIENVRESSEKVYQLALEMIENGEIKGASIHEISNCVAFFTFDDFHYLYIPAIEGRNSNNGENFAVAAITPLSTLENGVISILAGFNNGYLSAKSIYDNVDECDSLNNITQEYVTVDNLKNELGDLIDLNTRAIFWWGHGGLYYDQQGQARVAYAISEKVTNTSKEKYAYDREKENLLLNGEHIMVTSKFFEEYLCDVNGGLFFSGTCYGGADGGVMADILFKKGFDCYVGANDSIFTLYAGYFMGAVAEALYEQDNFEYYLSIKEAFEIAKQKHGETDFFKIGVGFNLFENPDSETFRLMYPDEETIYRRFIQERLAPEYGIFDPVKVEGTMRTWQDVWFSNTGILSAYIDDLNQDDKKELMVLYLQESQLPYTSTASYVLFADVYSIDKGIPVKTDTKAIGPYSETDDLGHGYAVVSVRANQFTEENLTISTVTTGDNDKYIIVENTAIASVFADGSSKHYWGLKYDKGELNIAFSFTQTDGGSSGFEYTGYELEAGEVISKELLYSEWHGTEGTYDNFGEALKEFFGRFGIITNYKDRNTGILNAEPNAQTILSYSIKCTNKASRESSHIFAFEMLDYTNLRQYIK